MVRLPVLDFLRGFAIVLVFLYHLIGLRYGWVMYRWDGNFRSGEILGVSDNWIALPVTWGWTGVSLFFVLSGFVIHLQTVQRTTFAAWTFYQRRLWRIVPIYYLAMMIWGYHYWVTPFEWSGQKQYLTHALFVHHMFSDTFFGINGDFWSLGAEMQFYFAYPIIIWLRPRIGMRNILLSVVFLSAVTRGLMSIWYSADNPISPLWTSFPMLWMDWVLGAYMAEKFYKRERMFQSPLWFPATLTLFLLAGLWKPTNCLTFSLASLTWATIVEKLIYLEWKPQRFGRALGHIGLVSYSMYLWHDPFIELVNNHLENRGIDLPLIPFIGVTFVLVWLVSTVSYHLIENPRWWYRRLANNGKPTPRE